jgi:hypothetical protein
MSILSSPLPMSLFVDFELRIMRAAMHDLGDFPIRLGVIALTLDGSGDDLAIDRAVRVEIIRTREPGIGRVERRHFGDNENDLG